MSLTRKMFSNSFYLFLDLLVVNFFGLIFWLFNGRFLIPKELGIVSTSINLALLLSSLSLIGFQGVLQKLIPEYLEKKQHSKIVSLSRFTLKVILISNTTIFLILIVFSLPIQSLLNLPEKALTFSSFLLLSFTFSNFFGYIMLGFQNMRTFFTTDLIGVMTKLLLTTILLFLGFGYTGPLIGVLIGYILIDLRRFRKSWFFPSSEEKINGREIFFDYALPYFTSLVAGLAFSNLQILLLASLKGQYVTGGYSMALLIASIISIIPSVLSQALFPIISQLSVGRKVKKQSYLTQLVLRYALFVMLPLATALIFFSKPILLLLRREYIEVTCILSILTIASLLFGLGQLFLSTLYAVGKTKLNRNIWVASALIFLLISSILIKLYSAQGLAISYTSASLIFLFLGYHYLKKTLIFRIDWRNLLKLVIPFILLFLFFYFADTIQASLLIKIIFAVFGGFVYLLTLIPLRFYKKEDLKILHIILEKLPIMRKQFLAFLKWFSKYVQK
ncbi:MAG: oligosaccharide flippase family protein [Candidatus Aenigmatarchaeota archaeon]